MVYPFIGTLALGYAFGLSTAFAICFMRGRGDSPTPTPTPTPITAQQSPASLARADRELSGALATHYDRFLDLAVEEQFAQAKLNRLHGPTPKGPF
jgi:hypothetical protein